MSTIGCYAYVRQIIAMIFDSNYRCYRYRRIEQCLRLDGTPLLEKVVRRLMTEEGLVAGCMQRRRFKTYRGELSPAPENIISRDFESEKPNQKWLTDCQHQLTLSAFSRNILSHS